MNLKKSAAGLAAAAAVALLCAAGAITVYSEDIDPNNHDHSGWTEWTSTDSLPDMAGSYYLTEDVEINLLKDSSYNYWYAPAGEYNLCLNGHTITVNYTMNIGSGSDFNIYDCQDECGGIVIERNTSAALFYVLSGKLTVYNGRLESKYGRAISQSNSDSVTTIEGGTMSGRINGIYVSSGKVTVNRGNIEGSKDYQWSAGIECYGSNAELIVNNGGNISGSEDGIYVVSGKITVNGGMVSGTTNAIQSNGADVTIKLSGNPTLNGDIYLTDGVKITVEDTLTNTVPYSIRMSSVGVFTDSSNTDLNDAGKFEPAQIHSDNGYTVVKNSDGQLALELKIYTVTYDGGEYGEGTIDSVTETCGTSITLSSEKFTRTGYTQTGWATEDGGDKVYDFGDTYSGNADITLYPVWEEDGQDEEDPAPTPSTPVPSTPAPSVPGTSAPEPSDPAPSEPEPSEPEPADPEPTEPPAAEPVPDGDPNAGNVNVDSEIGENAPEVTISEETSDRLKEEVIAEHLTPEEKAAIENGADLDIILSVEDAGDSVPATDRQAAEAALADTEYTIGMYLNIDLIKLINGEQVGKITELSTPISITIEVPEALRGENRKFAILRVHEGEAEILTDTDSDPDTITILTDRFSTYAIVYQDSEGDSNPVTSAALAIAPLITAAAAAFLSVKRKY